MRTVPALEIAGVEPFSSCDWPGRLVATVFLQGCPWRCTYCHNSAIIDPRTPGRVAWADVLELLRSRRGLLDGVVFSGGEPTRQAGLVDAVRDVRELGLAVGLHTGGAYPRRLSELLTLVDWVGFDIKAPVARYAAITGVEGSAGAPYRSLRLLLDASVPVQVRTTVDPTVLTPSDVLRMRQELVALGVTDLVVQEARPDGAPAAFVERLTEHRRAVACSATSSAATA